MPHNIDLILTLTLGFTAALALGFVTQKLRLSPIVGYLLAGILVGPFTPGYVADKDIATQFAEIGVILLMFGVGLHFHLKDLLAVRQVAIPGAVVQIAAATVLGAVVTRTIGWNCIWIGDLCSEHRGAHAGVGGQSSPAYSQRSYCHWLADR
jgi:monovalent cation:H+ antiporter-2, CPA2 family